MIPKIIHYCWFGGNPLPEDALVCIKSWKKYFPDYRIMEWNERNFDVNMIPYTREAYRLGKYAFVSDYVRMYILYKYGGIYFDTDVEVIRPMDSIVERGQFMGFESGQENYVAIGLGMGLEAGSEVARSILDVYAHKHFSTLTGVMTGTVVDVVTDLYKRADVTECEDGIMLWNNVYIYPPEYFCPLNYYTKELTITDTTVSIHHYFSSWCDKKNRNIFDKISKRLRFIFARLMS